jgi:hypothetical protein
MIRQVYTYELNKYKKHFFQIFSIWEPRYTFILKNMLVF